MAIPKIDNLNIEILPDGSLKIETDQISGANHIAAEALLKYLSELTAGPTTRTKRGHHHHGTHEHSHDHETEGHSH